MRGGPPDRPSSRSPGFYGSRATGIRSRSAVRSVRLYPSCGTTSDDQPRRSALARAELIEINGGPALAFSAPDRVIATVTFDFDADGRITAVHNVADPGKLQAIVDGAARDIATR
ncbi:hypothetical protein Srubr_80480 [Streptomyces rubradiris]|uniref:RNA polymerase sigma-70 factor, ECF subfamily n=1 Tax=Streptomyces rubradiris TaxID=285531 RepID=A0ABQ3RQY3_STRRR|nr:hypothetical protein GCM10018792_63170 [Streptomyces rubradiris]GHI58202.1 hypothetical protein Srubr_80480 [Streptomyces rubradiris]